MKTAVKAALLSALVFPGLGQMYLKRYVRGLIPMVLTLTGLGVWIAQATVGALQELDRLSEAGIDRVRRVEFVEGQFPHPQSDWRIPSFQSTRVPAEP